MSYSMVVVTKGNYKSNSNLVIQCVVSCYKTQSIDIISYSYMASYHDRTATDLNNLKLETIRIK